MVEYRYNHTPQAVSQHVTAGYTTPATALLFIVKYNSSERNCSYMDFNTYQQEAVKTAVYPTSVQVVYPAMGLANEAGELLGKLKKVLRGDANTSGLPNGISATDARAVEFYINLPAETLIALKGEVGDVLWYLAALCDDLGFDLDEIAESNIAKLKSRQDRGVLKGSGDNR